MNKLIIIGNGFDLSHGLKTSYKDFLEWYISRQIEQAYNSSINEDQTMIEVKMHKTNFYGSQSYVGDLEGLINTFINKSDHFTNQKEVRQVRIVTNYRDEVINFSVKIKSNLLHELLKQRIDLNWVDIEHLFYQLLLRVLTNKLLSYSASKNELEIINSELENLKNGLAIYLTEVTNEAKINEDFFELANEKINVSALLEQHHLNKEVVAKSLDDRGFIHFDKVTFLDFNYTNIIRQLLAFTTDFNYIHIHGALGDDKNPLIFGYGDEVDSAYADMEKSNINEYLKNIKSFGYFKTSNYAKLVNSINSAPFIIYVWGHSCGLSDRTLLSMIFEHDNCAGIKVFYREKSGTDNFDEIAQNISRHFKNKQKLRNRLFNKTLSVKFPQTTQQ